MTGSIRPSIQIMNRTHKAILATWLVVSTAITIWGISRGLLLLPPELVANTHVYPEPVSGGYQAFLELSIRNSNSGVWVPVGIYENETVARVEAHRLQATFQTEPTGLSRFFAYISPLTALISFWLAKELDLAEHIRGRDRGRPEQLESEWRCPDCGEWNYDYVIQGGYGICSYCGEPVTWDGDVEIHLVNGEVGGE